MLFRSNGRLKAFTADKGEPLLDLALPLNSGVGPPMTYMFEGKQYIAVFAGTGAQGRGAAKQQEATAAAAKGKEAPVPLNNTNPKLLVYAVSN